MSNIKPQWRPSPNFSERQQALKFIVLHCTEIENDADALCVYADPKAELSCHYYIAYDGTLMQLVADKNTAWHAGLSAWGEVQNLNHASIGIEMGYPGEKSGQPYAETTYQTLVPLLQHLLKTHNIEPQHVLAHSDIAPSRKKDPGKFFDWQRLEKQNLAAPWRPAGGTPSLTDPLKALHNWGYRGTKADVVKAFQRRYLPDFVSGDLCERTKAFICGLK